MFRAMKKPRKLGAQRILFLCWVLAGISLWAPQGSLGADTIHPHRLTRALAALLGPRDAIFVADPEGRPLVALNSETPLIPASILKILTASAALDQLGADYRFHTDFRMDPHHNMIIQGYGDPLLISERLAAIGKRLAEKVTSIHDLVLDDTYIHQPVVIPGRGVSNEPYDAPNGALCVNFNTVAFRRTRGGWDSDEAQTPLLPSVIPKIEASGLHRGRITLAGNSSEALAYTGEMFQFFLTQAGIRMSGSIRRGQMHPERDRLVWRYDSHDNLGEVVGKLLEFSNNFIANQVLLVLGAHHSGAPATMEKGLTVLREYYRRDLGIQTGLIVEGSGISRQNRMTARAMGTVLERFVQHHQRMRRQGRQFYKTGHLKGIRTRAGYLASSKGGLYRFVVMINTPGKSTHIIMRLLEENLK